MMAAAKHAVFGQGVVIGSVGDGEDAPNHWRLPEGRREETGRRIRPFGKSVTWRRVGPGYPSGLTRNLPSDDDFHASSVRRETGDEAARGGDSGGASDNFTPCKATVAWTTMSSKVR
jgi:hypothetical protein